MAAPRFDEQTQKIILNAVRSGAKRGAAAKLALISPSTLTKWVQKGQEDEEGGYNQFVLQLLKAEAQHEQDLVKTMGDALEDAEGNANGAIALAMLKARHGWGMSSDKFIDYLVERLSTSQPELLADILTDIANGVLD